MTDTSDGRKHAVLAAACATTSLTLACRTQYHGTSRTQHTTHLISLSHCPNLQAPKDGCHDCSCSNEAGAVRALICDGQQAIGGRLVMWLHQSWRMHIGACIHQAPNDPHDHNVCCMHTVMSCAHTCHLTLRPHTGATVGLQFPSPDETAL